MKKFTLFLSLLFSFTLSACNTSNSGDINDDQSDKTVSITNFEKTNDGFLGKIDNNIETFSFINRVNVPKNATWTIYKDVAGTIEVPTKTIECQVGDNYVYLLVNGEKESLGFYKVDVYRYDLFTVSFNTNGGSYIEPQRVQEESLASKPENPTRDGYTFSQWDHDFNTPILADKTINASWTANQYVITFDVNGGDSLASNTMEVTFGQNVTLPTPTWTGHTFLGWFNNNRQYSSGVWRTSESLTLTAKWEVSRYTITYKVNGGILSNSSNTQTVTYGQAYELYSATKTGYRFDGWYNGSNKFENGIWNLEQNIELDAHWTANQYTITYVLNNGTQSESTTQIVTYDESFTLTTPTREGYSFDGWFDGNDKVVSGVWKRDGDLTLTAHWTPITYTVSLSMPSSITHYYVTFDNNDGTGVYLEKEIKLGEVLERPTSPTRSGYSFRAWYKEAACTTPFNFNEEITESITLYAGWYEASASWDVNVNKSVSVKGGSGSTASTRYFVCPYTTSYKFTATSNSNVVFKIEIVLSSKAGSNVYKSSYNGYNSTYSLSGKINPTEITFNAEAGTVIYLSFTETANKNTTSFTITLTCSFECTVPEETSVLSTNAKPIPQNVTYDANFDFGVVNYPGYTFNGWYTEPNGNGVKLTDSTGKSLDVWKSTNVSTIYAYLIPNQYTITYDPDGGVLDSTTQTVSYNSDFTLKTPTRTGYSFYGWYLGDDKFESGKWTLTDNITLKAKWGIISYGVTFSEYTTGIKYYLYCNHNLDSGLIQQSVEIDRYNQAVYPNIPTQSGYIFTGWYSDEACTQRFNFEGTLTSSKTIYAGWRKPTFSNTFYNLVLNGTSYTAKYTNGGSSTNFYFTALSTGTYKINYNCTASTYLYFYDLDDGQGSHSYVASLSGSSSYSISVQEGKTYNISFGTTQTSYQTGTTVTVGISGTLPTNNVKLSMTPSLTRWVNYGKNYNFGVPDEREGMTFVGWFTEPNGQGEKVTDETGQTIQTWHFTENNTNLYSYFI